MNRIEQITQEDPFYEPIRPNHDIKAGIQVKDLESKEVQNTVKNAYKTYKARIESETGQKIDDGTQ